MTATGTGTLSYQWKKNGAAISGATSASYTTPATVASDNGASFTVTVTGTSGSVTSNAATLTVNAPPAPPSITTQPASKSVIVGQTATFSVTATGTGTLTYQWNKGGDGHQRRDFVLLHDSRNDTAQTAASQFTVTVSNSVGQHHQQHRNADSDRRRDVDTQCQPDKPELLQRQYRQQQHPARDPSPTAGTPNVTISNVIDLRRRIYGQRRFVRPDFDVRTNRNAECYFHAVRDGISPGQRHGDQQRHQLAGVRYIVRDGRPAGIALGHADLDGEHVHGDRLQRVPVHGERRPVLEVEFHRLVAATTYTDSTVQASQTYFYVVTSVDSSGVESAYSTEVSVTVP